MLTPLLISDVIKPVDDDEDVCFFVSSIPDKVGCRLRLNALEYF